MTAVKKTFASLLRHAIGPLCVRTRVEGSLTKLWNKFLSAIARSKESATPLYPFEGYHSGVTQRAFEYFMILTKATKNAIFFKEYIGRCENSFKYRTRLLVLYSAFIPCFEESNVRRGGLTVSALDSGSNGPVFLGKTLHSHSAFLHPGVEMGAGDIMLGVGFPAMD